MIPVLTPDEMAGVDRCAPEPVDVLVERAGFAAAGAARRLLGGAYGRRVIVVAGRGNNGADGRAAAAHLRSRGAMVEVVEAASLGADARLPAADLVIDAAYGTGLGLAYSPPDPGGTPVLAVDIPSGLSGLTGLPLEGGGAVTAARTVTFAAYKPGLLLGAGPEHAGAVEVAGIGLEGLAARATRSWLVTDGDVAKMLPPRPRQGHKWQAAVHVVGGSPGMYGAPLLVASGAMRAGAGYVLVGVPGSPEGGGLPPGAHVGHALPARGWDVAAVAATRRRPIGAVVVGPGLGSSSLGHGGETGSHAPVALLLIGTPDVAAVVDAGAITALGDLDTVRAVADRRTAPMVLTPHAGEYSRLVGRPPGDDRVSDVRAVAARSGAAILLKGSPTVVAAPDGRVLVVTSGSPRLATAGSGDVLSGVIGAFVARGLPPFEAAALAAHAHGRAAGEGPAEGLVATDLPGLVSRWLSGQAEVER
ncbi:MAG: NAD(P)H-hydrate dehydratase [Acidimicrobiales bacterium]